MSRADMKQCTAFPLHYRTLTPFVSDEITPSVPHLFPKCAPGFCDL